MYMYVPAHTHTHTRSHTHTHIYIYIYIYIYICTYRALDRAAQERASIARSPTCDSTPFRLTARRPGTEGSERRGRKRGSPSRRLASGVHPPLRALTLLAQHHSKPDYKELRPHMGRGGKQHKAWEWKGEQWPSRRGEGSDSWRQSSSSQGKWDDWRQPRRAVEEPEFPTYTMMSTAGSRHARDPDDAEGDRPMNKQAGLAKGYQRLVTAARKAEVRIRKVQEDMEAAKQCWKMFQDKLQKAFVKERLRHKQDLEKLEDELAQQEQAQLEAFRDLQAAIANPASLQTGRQAEVPEDIYAEWGRLLQSCDQEDDEMMDVEEAFTEKLSRQLQQVLEPAPRTPTRSRADRAAPRTPPCPAGKEDRGTRESLSRFVDKAMAMAMQRQQEQQAQMEQPTPVDDPYMTSPSANVGLPTPPHRAKATTPRIGIKLKGRQPVPSPKPGSTLAAKLDKVRHNHASKDDSEAQHIETDEEDDLLVELPKKTEDGRGESVE